MKTRLLMFVFALLLLPFSGLFLSGAGLSDLTLGTMGEPQDLHDATTGLLLTLFGMSLYLLLVDSGVGRLTGHNPFRQQRTYFLVLGAASAVLGWLLVYLNLFVASWAAHTDYRFVHILLYTLLFALLAPAVLLTRSLLATFGGPLKRLSSIAPLPALRGETSVRILLPLSVLGLLGGAAWPVTLFWLFWLSPLLLLAALQLLWGEGTVFSALKTGNWARLLFAALAGIITCDLAAFCYQLGGDTLTFVHAPFFTQAGHAVFGLLCLQLGDVIAENWRGTTRAEQFQKKHRFPIPVITRKE